MSRSLSRFYERAVYQSRVVTAGEVVRLRADEPTLGEEDMSPVVTETRVQSVDIGTLPGEDDLDLGRHLDACRGSALGTPSPLPPSTLSPSPHQARPKPLSSTVFSIPHPRFPHPRPRPNLHPRPLSTSPFPSLVFLPR